MAKIKNSVTAEALKLPIKSRAQLAEKLIYSLEEGSHTKNERLWAKESLSRYKAMAAGKVKGKPAAKVLKEIRSKLK
jgi:putative addiction module component (TIGR02574 family)